MAKYAVAAAPRSNCPSWPMFVRPALETTIVPIATPSSGVAVEIVNPQAPGDRTLPSSSAENTFAAEPPVADTTTAHSPRAAAIHVA